MNQAYTARKWTETDGIDTDEVEAMLPFWCDQAAVETSVVMSSDRPT